MLVKDTSQFCKGELGLIPNQSTKTGVNIHPSILLKEALVKIPAVLKLSGIWEGGLGA